MTNLHLIQFPARRHGDDWFPFGLIWKALSRWLLKYSESLNVVLQKNCGVEVAALPVDVYSVIGSLQQQAY